MARLRDETGLTGVAVAVMTDGRLAGMAASGERRRGSSVAVTVDDRWHAGSITKSMTATLLAVLEDDGRLSRDDTLPALLPDMPMAGGWDACTLHHLLTHTAGVRASAGFGPPRGDVPNEEPVGARGPAAPISKAGGSVQDARRQLAGDEPRGCRAHDDRGPGALRSGPRGPGSRHIATACHGPPGSGRTPRSSMTTRAAGCESSASGRGVPCSGHNGSNTLWYALLMLLPARNTVLAFATNDGAIRAAETAFVKPARELGGRAPAS